MDPGSISFQTALASSGLDPAGPIFELAKPGARLDKGDADFVDVLHTNAGSILQARVGLTLAIGHADFYVNGGSLQHGCAGGDGSVTFGSSVEDLIGRKRRGFLGFLLRSTSRSLQGSAAVTTERCTSSKTPFSIAGLTSRSLARATTSSRKDNAWIARIQAGVRSSATRLQSRANGPPSILWTRPVPDPSSVKISSVFVIWKNSSSSSLQAYIFAWTSLSRTMLTLRAAASSSA